MAAKTNILRREAREALEELKGPTLRVARDFLEYLRLLEEQDPTIEILADRAMMRDIRAARSDLKKGRAAKFTSWEKVKQDV